MDTDTARTAADILRRYAATSRQRAYVQIRLERVLRELARWDAWDANEQLPPHRRGDAQPPLLEVDSLESLRAMLLEELALLEAEES